MPNRVTGRTREWHNGSWQ